MPKLVNDDHRPMKKLILRYRTIIRNNIKLSSLSDDRDLRYWQDQLFFNFLVYCLPVGLVALLPGIIMAIKDGFPVIAAVDLTSFALVVLVTFFLNISLRARKVFIITVFYFLAVFLINSLGYVGPGVFYLFFITVLVALIFPIRYAYLSVLSNAAVLLLFALIIGLRLFNCGLIQGYTVGKWLAFSSNLIFASIIIVLMIKKIFEGLQLTIVNKTQLQERYQSMFYNSPQPMWLYDTDTLLFLDVNEAAIRQYGYSKEEFLAMTILEIRLTENNPGMKELIALHKQTGAYFAGKSQHLKKNGELIYVDIESNQIDIDGRQVRLVLAADVTTQVQHQLEMFDVNLKIKESESNMRAIFDNVPDGFVLLDARYVIKLFNAKASESMKFNKDQIAFEIGRNIFDYVETYLMSYFKKITERVYSGETVEYDRRFRADNGKISWIRYTLTPVREELKIIGACITGRDITVRKLYLRSIEEQNKTFREISWIQSHLVRAPLARIMGLLPMLGTACCEQEKAEIISYLQISATELNDMIWQITEKSAKIIEKNPESGISH